MFVRFLLAATLLGGLLSRTSWAQTAPPPARFYVGLGASRVSNVPFNDLQIRPLAGPSLTAGLQFTPRWAAQAGLSYYWQNTSHNYQFVPAPGSASSVTATFRARYVLVPVLLRYTVTAPGKRFRFDVLGGAMWLHGATRRTYESDGPGAIDPALRPSRTSYSRFGVTLGPAVRLAIAPRLELTAAALVNAGLGQNFDRFQERLLLSTALGVNYAFGQR